MRAIAAALVCCVAASPAAATGSIACSSPDDDGVAVELTIGSLPVLGVAGALVTAGGETWSTATEAGEQISAGQAFREADRLLVDFTDPNVERVVVELRLFQAQEERDAAMAGTLRIPGKGAWPLVCAGP